MRQKISRHPGRGVEGSSPTAHCLSGGESSSIKKSTYHQELETDTQSHAERVRVDEELIRGLRDEQDALRQEPGSKTGGADLNLKLDTKLQAEEEVSQALQREIAQLNEELREQEEESLTVLQALELVPEPKVSEEKLPETKKEVLCPEKSPPLSRFMRKMTMIH